MSEKKDFRNYALKDKNIRGHLFDSYVEVDQSGKYNTVLIFI